MFNKTRLKLTGWYLLIIMVISLSFSFVIYKTSVTEVERFDRTQRQRIQIRFGYPPIPMIDPNLLQETENRIISTLVFINIAILITSGVTGYFLAGITMAPIEEMIEVQKRFISDASHEISTPLTSLKTAMEVYLRDTAPTLSDSKTLVKESIDEVNKLQSLSSSLLQLAQYEKPNGHTKFEILSIKEVLDESIKKVLPLAKQKNISIDRKIKNLKVKGNSYSLIDLFVILLDNAIKYSPKGKVIKVITQKSDGHILISIKDEGIGIEKVALPHIFDRFYRADSARSKTNSGGYGLGLSIAQKIVTNHHGTINVESKINSGTTFIIKLPTT